MKYKKSVDSRVVVETNFHGVSFSFESGWIAKQADGAVIARMGDTVVLATVCAAPCAQERDFFPLVVEYQEKAYAAGRIPGGFIKREGRPGEHEILTCRLIDRPIRPMFEDGFMDEVQIICTVLSADGVSDPDIVAICAAGAALHISPLPFLGPLAAVSVGRVDGTLVINPSRADQAFSDIDLVVAGTRDSIVMVEGGANMVSESDVVDSLFFGHSELQQILDLQDKLREKLGKPKREFEKREVDPAIAERVRGIASQRIAAIYDIADKLERGAAYDAVKNDALAQLEAEFPEKELDIKEEIHSIWKKLARERIVKTKVRIDGRNPGEVRPIECEVGILPRAHGSALFTRGETQALVSATLGTSMDAQRTDTLTEQSEKEFMLHYNFPPFSTGEVKMLRGAGRREIGHGALALRALSPVVPSGKDFPYVVRVVSDIMESNGSSSMASVCGGSLSMMDAGVKIADAVAGVAMGLIKEGDDVVVLTDILGDEDHFGDMDFKVCGTKNGVTALQMDIKCKGLDRAVMERALEQAREARLHVLGEMAKALNEPREKMSPYAPVIQTFKINPDKIRDVIGPGGKTIRSIVESTGVKIDIDDDGSVHVASSDAAASARAIEIIRGLTEEAEIGKVYRGVVKRVVDFGAFVEILPGVEGLVHISQLAHEHVKNVFDIVQEGDEIMVRVLDIDRQGRIRLSRKEALDAE